MWLQERLWLILKQLLKVLKLQNREESDIQINSILNDIKNARLTRHCKKKKVFHSTWHRGQQDLGICQAPLLNKVKRTEKTTLA